MKKIILALVMLCLIVNVAVADVLGIWYTIEKGRVYKVWFKVEKPTNPNQQRIMLKSDMNTNGPWVRQGYIDVVEQVIWMRRTGENEYRTYGIITEQGTVIETVDGTKIIMQYME